MTEEFLDEALTIRDEFIMVKSHLKGEHYWEDMVNLAKKGDINRFLQLWSELCYNDEYNRPDEGEAYFIWSYYRGPFRDEDEGGDKVEPYDDLYEMTERKFCNLLDEVYEEFEKSGAEK